jgi:DNA-directed RNA polymerase beta subunit
MQKQQKVIRFGKIKSGIELPNLIENQTESFKWFLQKMFHLQKGKIKDCKMYFWKHFLLSALR